MTDLRIELLDELTQRLEAMVSMLGGVEVPSAAVLDRIWTATSETFDRFHGAAQEYDSEPLPADVRSRMEGVLRLDAVAVGLASRHRDGLSSELEKMSATRSRLEVLHLASRALETGDSCDMTG